MAWQIEGDRAPSRIERFELGQGGSPHRPVQRQTMEEHDRGPLVGRADIIGRQAGVRRGRDPFRCVICVVSITEIALTIPVWHARGGSASGSILVS